MSDKPGVQGKLGVFFHAITAECKAGQTVVDVQLPHEVGARAIGQSEVGYDEVNGPACAASSAAAMEVVPTT